jgi:PAS domain S-box-containing protein
MSALSRKAPSAVDPIASIRRALLTRLLPTAILTTLGLGWLRLQGEKAGFYGTSFGVGLMVILTISWLAIFVWWTTRALNRAETGQAVVEHALRTSEQRARLVIESAYDAFIAMDAEGVIIDWNTEAEKIFGISSSQAIGRKLSETIIPERHRERHQAGLEHFLKTGEGPLLGKRLEIDALRADSSEFRVVLAISPVHWADTWIFNAFLHEITDPKEMEAVESAVPQVSDRPIASGLRILLVEDHLRTRATLARLLENWGHSVQQADTLAQGRQLIRSQSFDLLVTDVALPDGEGSDLMREIRETSGATPGIAMTGFDSPASAAASVEAGFLLHFTKPIPTEKLKSAIEEIAKAQQEMTKHE